MLYLFLSNYHILFYNFFLSKVLNFTLKMPPHIRVSSETRATINPKEMDEQLQRLRDRLGGPLPLRGTASSGLVPSRSPLRVHQSTSVVSGSFLCEYLLSQVMFPSYLPN